MLLSDSRGGFDGRMDRRVERRDEVKFDSKGGTSYKRHEL